MLCCAATASTAAAPVVRVGPTIAVVNQSAEVSTAQLDAALPTFQWAVDRAIGPIWNLDATLTTAAPTSNDWIIYISDSAPSGPNGCGCYGYHDYIKGRPVAFIYAATSDGADGSTAAIGGWTDTFSHELFEMLVDPHIDRAAVVAGLNDANPPQFWLEEVGDPVDNYVFHHNGVALSDFVTSRWYLPNVHRRLDYMNMLSDSLTVASNGGYAVEFINGAWTNVPPTPWRTR